MLTVLFAINFLGMLVLPIVLAFYLTRKFDLEWKLVFAGAGTFIVSQILHIPFLKILTDVFNNIGFSTSSDTARVILNAIVLGLAAGVFEETARWVLFKFFLKDVKTWNEGMLVGAGHGGVEALLLGALGTLTFVNMLLMRNANLANLGVPADQIEVVKQQVAAFWATPAYIAILGVVERVFAICLHLTLSVMVLYSVVYKKPLWFWAALLWHALVDGVAVYFLSIVDSVTLEGIVGVLAIISLVILFKMCSLYVNIEPTPIVTEISV